MKSSRCGSIFSWFMCLLLITKMFIDTCGSDVWAGKLLQLSEHVKKGCYLTSCCVENGLEGVVTGGTQWETTLVTGGGMVVAWTRGIGSIKIQEILNQRKNGLPFTPSKVVPLFPLLCGSLFVLFYCCHFDSSTELRLSVAPEMDIMDYCKKEWRGNTQKATCMKKVQPRCTYLSSSNHLS